MVKVFLFVFYTEMQPQNIGIFPSHTMPAIPLNPKAELMDFFPCRFYDEYKTRKECYFDILNKVIPKLKYKAEVEKLKIWESDSGYSELSEDYNIRGCDVKGRSLLRDNGFKKFTESFHEQFYEEAGGSHNLLLFCNAGSQFEPLSTIIKSFLNKQGNNYGDQFLRHSNIVINLVKLPPG